MKILVTGGAGFIGLRLTRRLLASGHSVCILDSLVPQVHGKAEAVPAWLRAACEVHIADVCDRTAVRAALQGVDAVAHLAAETGPAQSMYEIARYAQANVQGTAVLLEEMLAVRTHIKRLIVASSRAVYGEGKYECARCGVVYPDPRSDERLRAGLWEPICPRCGSEVQLLATDEMSLPRPTSIYAVTKLTQEQMCLAMGRAYGIPTIALRYQNVYGSGQSLTNPYIGVLAIFSAQIKSGDPIRLYEDGAESRDFVHVDDVVNATQLALETETVASEVFNVGSGRACTLQEVATTLARVMQRETRIEVTGNYRVGDIRHCYADLTAISSQLGYRPAIDLEAGLAELAEWARQETVFSSKLDQATRELAQAGLYR